MPAVDPGVHTKQVWAEVTKPVYNAAGVVIMQPGTLLGRTDPFLTQILFSYRLVIR